MSATTFTEFTSLESHRRMALQKLVSAGPLERSLLAQDALGRLDSGAYGYCLRCGIRIPEAALERRPERVGCQTCDPD